MLRFKTLICTIALMFFTTVALASYQKVADNTVPAYHNPELTQRTGNERVDKGDLVTVFEERANAYFVRYPVKNGTKDRWVPKNIFNAPQGRDPEGALEAYGTLPNMLRLVGWAFDADDMNSKTRIHVYIGGEAGNTNVPSYEIKADKSHAKFNGHGFDQTINVPTNWCGNRTVRLYALNDVGGGNFKQIGSLTVDIPAPNDNNNTNTQTTQTGYINTQSKNLNLRNAPNGAIIGKLSKGTRVTIIQGDSNGWTRVKTASGQEGYVSSQYVAIDGKNNEEEQQSITNNNYRHNALQAAREMVEVRWTAPCDFVTWCSSKGAYNRVVDVNGTSDTMFRRGRTYTGIPYSMLGRTYTKDKFLNYLGSHSQKANYQGADTRHGKPTTKVGIDCSYFVWSAINNSGSPTKIGSNYTTTSTLLNSGLFKQTSYANMNPGDIFLKKGSHVMMLVEKLSNGNCIVYEADANDSKCSQNTYNSSNLLNNGYVGYTFVGYN